MAPSIEARLSSFSIESMVRGHHIYKERWSPYINEELYCQREPRADSNCVPILM